MPHEIDRVLAAVAHGVWAIDPEKAQEILAVLALRAEGQVSAWDDMPRDRPQLAAASGGAGGNGGQVYVIPLHGTVFPRAGMMAAMSGGVSLDQFGRVFRQVAADPQAGAIVLDVDSPGGDVSLVPETAAMIRAARREDRPIVAVANTLAASAAYWIAAAADEVVVSPSARVGSIGVYTMHDDMTKAMEQRGVRRTMIAAGPRKVEGHPFAPLDDVARKQIQQRVNETYAAFTGDVAKFRGVEAAVVRADPETAERHMGGGRAYAAREAVRLGMADRIATLDDTIARLVSGRGGRRSDMARRRLALI